MALGAAALLRPAEAGPAGGCFSLDGHTVACSHGFPDPPPIPAQPCRALCWATSLAYMLQGYGAEIGTLDVLGRYGLAPACQKRDDRASLLRAAGQWRDTRGRDFLVRTTELASLHRRYASGQGIDDVLSRVARQPILCGAAGHTTVVTEVQVAHTALSGLRRDRVTVVDPYAPNARCRDLSFEELRRPFYMIALSIRAL